ncbi:heterokaryon incompatibility protein-domain-containing protein, partial [Diaporthe sp. PMI_573]
MFPSERPTRLLEITPCDHPNQPYGYLVKLIETNGRDHTYVALSYCWGTIQDTAWMTKNDTIHQNMEDIDLESLQATIRDCLWVATALGVRNVWVDSLCIIQDNASDWEIESAKMGGIYRGALLTIAASRGSSSSKGLFNRNRAPSHFNPFAFFRYICVESRLRKGDISRLYFDRIGTPSSEEDLL